MASAAGQGGRRTVPAPHLILIDDEVDLLHLMAEELTFAGFEVTAVESGRAAIEAARNRRFDVAITDLKMPDLDGLQTAAALKDLDPDLPIIVATGFASEAAIVASGAKSSRGRAIVVALLLKPFGIDEVLETLQNVLQGKTPAVRTGVPS
jgi:CheY-like chemotaxis protein